MQVPAQRYGTSRARVAATVFATESLLDGIAFAVLGLIGLALIDLHDFPTGVFWGVLGLVTRRAHRRDPAVAPASSSRAGSARGVLARLPERRPVGLEQSVPHFIDGLVVFKDLRLGAQAIALSFAIWLHRGRDVRAVRHGVRHPPADRRRGC